MASQSDSSSTKTAISRTHEATESTEVIFLFDILIYFFLQEQKLNISNIGLFKVGLGFGLFAVGSRSV